MKPKHQHKVRQCACCSRDYIVLPRRYKKTIRYFGVCPWCNTEEGVTRDSLRFPDHDREPELEKLEREGFWGFRTLIYGKDEDRLF